MIRALLALSGISIGTAAVMFGPVLQASADIAPRDAASSFALAASHELGAPVIPLVPGENPCTQPAPPFSLGATQWNGWGRDADNSRYQPQPGIAAADVPRLQLKWAWSYPPGSRVFTQPSVAGGRIFVASAPGDGNVYSLDARTGCTYWTYGTGVGARSAIVIGELPAGSAARYAAFIAVNSAGTAEVHAVNAETGAPLWKTVVDDHPRAVLTGSPVFHDGRLYVPVSSHEEPAAQQANYQCCTFRGNIVALQASTGTRIWKAYTIEAEPRPTRTNSAGTQMHGPAGGAIWSTPTVDARRGVIYATTGNSYTDEAENGANAVIAFDLATGAVRWRNKTTEDDNYVMGCSTARPHPNCPEEMGPDVDFGVSAIVRNLPDGRTLLLAGQKSGMVYAFDADKNGELVWNDRLGAGGALGGVEWGMAADERTLYVAMADVAAGSAGGTRRPGVTALDIATGDERWHWASPTDECNWLGQGGAIGRGGAAPPPAAGAGGAPGGGRGGAATCPNGMSAPVSVIPGVVFAPSQDGNLRAFDAANGSVIWKFDTARPFPVINAEQPVNGGSLDATGVVVVDGHVYVNSGYAQFGGRPGNIMLVFTVDGR